jgi:hypothetical protein
MRRMRLVGLALVAVFALTAVASSAAFAGEGPIWKVAGSKLESGITKNITAAKKAGSAEFKFKAGTLITINCTGASSTGTIIGGEPGTDTANIKFTGCTVEGHSECTVKSPKEGTEEVPVGEIRVKAKTELVYLSSTSATNEKVDASGVGSHLGDLFSPASGSTFVELVVGGNNCPSLTKGTNKVEGSVLSIVEPSEAEAASGTLNFPTSSIEKYWTRNGGVKSHEASLKVFGFIGCTQSGEETVELESKENFGAWL